MLLQTGQQQQIAQRALADAKAEAQVVALADTIETLIETRSPRH